MLWIWHAWNTRRLVYTWQCKRLVQLFMCNNTAKNYLWCTLYRIFSASALLLFQTCPLSEIWFIRPDGWLTFAINNFAGSFQWYYFPQYTLWSVISNRRGGWWTLFKSCITQLLINIYEYAFYWFFFLKTNWYDQVFDAAKRAAIHDTIMNFPEKYSTIVGERGLKVRDLVLIFI